MMLVIFEDSMIKELKVEEHAIKQRIMLVLCRMQERLR